MGTVLLIGGAVGGFLIARKVILNNKIKKENFLLRRGRNANLDAGAYSPPTLRATTTGRVRASPNSQFGLL